MPAKRDQELLVEVARLYYADGLDQGQIGKRLGLSRSSVSRILSSARETGIVQVRIAGEEVVTRNRALEETLISEFRLRRVLVGAAQRWADGSSTVGRLAASLFDMEAPKVKQVGLSWGQTVRRFVESVPTMLLGSETVLTPLVGGMPTVDTGPSGDQVTAILTQKCGILADRFDAPAIVESSVTWDAMMSESSVKNALARAARTDLAFVGVGSYGVETSRKIVDAMHLSSDELRLLEAAHPAGDICGRFFTVEGDVIGSPVANRVIGITIEKLKQVGFVVAMAAGEQKASGVLGALRTGAVDALIVDESLATALMALARTPAGTQKGSPAGDRAGG